MKKIITTSVLLLLITHAFSQTQKGKFLLGIDATQFKYNTTNNAYTISLFPQVGYFVANNVALGIIGQFSDGGNGGTTVSSPSWNLAIAPFLRAYLNHSNPVRFYIEPFAGIITEQYFTYFGNNNMVIVPTLGGTLGFTVFATKSLGIDFGFNYQYVSGYSYSDPGFYSSTVNIGSNSIVGFVIGLKGFLGKTE